MIGSLNLDWLTLIIIGVLAFWVERRGWVARWTIIANAVLLSGTLFPALAGSIFPSKILPAAISSFPDLLQWWMWGILIVAVAVMLDYFKKLDIPQDVKKWIFRIYSSKTVLGVLLATAFNVITLWFLFVIGIWIFACYKMQHEF